MAEEDRKQRPRSRGNGEGSVYQAKSGLWTASLELPSPDGSRRRKVIRRKDKKSLLAELTKLQAELQALGDLPTDNQTVEQWFTYWVDRIAAKEVRPNTLDGYRRTINLHVIPAIGKVKLSKVTAAHVRRVHDAITGKGLSSTTALLAHRVMAVSFKVAVREGRIPRNPAALTAAPRKAVTLLDVLDLPESLALLEYTLADPSRVRWATYLLTAARRGEVIGLERDRISNVIDLSWQLQRILYVHGCKGKCGLRFAGDCPTRTISVKPDFEYRHITGGLYWTRPKSQKGWRIIPLVDPLRSILHQHIETSPDNPHGLVFARADGQPYDPAQDTREWRTVMKQQFGDDRAVRLHDLRHTTVDLLYLAGVPEDIIMEVVGHSTRSQSQAYKSRGNIERLTGAMEQMSSLFTQPGQERRREIAG